MMDGLLISRPVSMKSKSEIKAEIRTRVAAEEKAFRWVERLAVEDFITRSELEEMVDTIMPSHYQDIVEERFASHICGYPLCSNRLHKVIKQKYHISNNRVYDMTERKCFCSVRCFKASKFLQSQIPEAPVWLRRNKSRIKLLDEVSERNDVKNLQSDEVDISGGLQRLNLRDVEDEEATAYNSVDATATPEIETNAFHDEKPVTRKSAESDSIGRDGNARPCLSRGLPGALLSEPKAVTPRSFPGDKEKPKSPLDSPLDLPQDRCLLLINALVSWLTDETYKFLSSNTAPSDVRSSGAVSENWNTRSFVLPAIDSKSQIQIRRGIVLDKLRSRLQKFLPVLELELLDVTSEVHELVYTLSLTSHNISLTSKDWSLLSLLVLRILSHRLHCVSEAFVRARRRLEIHLTEEYGVSWIDLEASLATHFSVTVPSVQAAIVQSGYSQCFSEKIFEMCSTEVPEFPEIRSKGSLVAKYVTPELWRKLAVVKTKTSGFTLGQAIACAIQFEDQQCGIYAGDEDTFTDFREVFDPIVLDYHGLDSSFSHQSDMDVSKLTGNIDPDAPVHSTRIRVGRNIEGFGLSPGITREQRLSVEKLMINAFAKLHGELSGKYHPLLGMDEAVRQQLIDDHFLFISGDKNLIASGMERDWPEGRGIFHNAAKTFLTWVNEEDQLRIISMQQGGDVRAVFSRLAAGIKAVQDSVKAEAGRGFQLHARYGYLHSCPTNLGTGMRASVHIDLPGWAAEGLPALKARCKELKLQPRGARGESGGHDGATYDISNRHRLGYSEVELVQCMIDGVNTLFKEDKELQSRHGVAM